MHSNRIFLRKIMPSKRKILGLPCASACKLTLALSFLNIALMTTHALGQSAPDQPSGDDSSDSTLTLFPHSNTSHYWISAQDNIIFQWHPAFFAKYSGPNSL